MCLTTLVLRRFLLTEQPQSVAFQSSLFPRSHVVAGTVCSRRRVYSSSDFLLDQNRGIMGMVDGGRRVYSSSDFLLDQNRGIMGMVDGENEEGI